jgi:hypothetical protein
MGRAVHILVFLLVLSPLISLPPKAKTQQGDHPYVVVTIIPDLSLGWLLAHSLVGMVHLGGFLALERGSSEMFGRVSSGFLRWLGFRTQTCFWGGAFGGSSNTPSLKIGSIGLGGVILINLGVVKGFSLGFKPLNSPTLP